MSAACNPRIDWEVIETQYRAGALSVRQIATEHGISEGMVRKKAKALKWERDLSAKVAQKVRTMMVRIDGTQDGTHPDGPQYRASPQSQNEAVDAAAMKKITLLREHRKDIARLRSALETLVEQATDAIGARPDLEETILEITAEDTDMARRNRLFKAVSLPTQMVMIKDASLTLRNIVPLERQAFGLGDLDDPAPSDSKGDRVSPSDEMLAAARERMRLRNDPKPADA